MREGIVDIALEEGHKQRIHNGDVESMDAGEKDVKLLVLAGTSRNARVVPSVAANLFEGLSVRACHSRCLRHGD